MRFSQSCQTQQFFTTKAIHRNDFGDPKITPSKGASFIKNYRFHLGKDIQKVSALD